jgi:voltage-gated potassium channel
LLPCRRRRCSRGKAPNGLSVRLSLRDDFRPPTLEDAAAARRLARHPDDGAQRAVDRHRPHRADDRRQPAPDDDGDDHLDRLPGRVCAAIHFAPKKLPFLKSNWLTAIALLAPALRLFAIFRFLRAASALRGFRLVKIVGTANRSMNALRRTLERRKFGYVVGLTLLVIGLGAAGMLNFEPAKEVPGGFHSYGDSSWWTAMLLTSIGSQYWPVTTEGRIHTVLLSLYGFATFGYITATFASYFVGRDAETKEGPVAGSNELQQLAQEVRALRTELERRSGAGGHTG